VHAFIQKAVSIQCRGCTACWSVPGRKSSLGWLTLCERKAERRRKYILEEGAILYVQPTPILYYLGREICWPPSWRRKCRENQRDIGCRREWEIQSLARLKYMINAENEIYEENREERADIVSLFIRNASAEKYSFKLREALWNSLFYTILFSILSAREVSRGNWSVCLSRPPAVALCLRLITTTFSWEKIFFCSWLFPKHGWREALLLLAQRRISLWKEAEASLDIIRPK